MGEITTSTQVSAGGVAFRKRNGKVEIALISVGEEGRWQLPKGLVGKSETPEEAAVREVQEEAGIETELVAPIDEIDYWFYMTRGNRRIRIHKFVKFFLLRYKSGDPKYHDQEVNEARWVDIDEAYKLLAFKSEKKVVLQAKDIIQGTN
jgi:8-oxo-dGTP pyrophosphatase MutT (NUDIX family)